MQFVHPAVTFSLTMTVQQYIHFVSVMMCAHRYGSYTVNTLSDNNGLSLPDGSVIVATVPTQPTAHTPDGTVVGVTTPLTDKIRDFSSENACYGTVLPGLALHVP
jgi:hypothetical protein